MIVLLDTHTLLWALGRPARLSEKVAALLRDRSVEVVVSAGSAWEIATKFRLGRLPEAASLVGSYPAQLARLKARELDVRSAHALLAGSLPIEHRDPFDRILALQSLVEGVPLVSNDPVFSSINGLTVVW